MNELERIGLNNNGEMPEGEKTIITEKDISNPEEVLENCKLIVKAFICNQDVKPHDKRWKTLLPPKVVKAIGQLSDDDFDNDDLLYSIKSVVEDFQDPVLRDWRWYSSKLEANGFKILFEGWCSFRNWWMVHIQLVPYSKITIETTRYGTYTPRVYKDIMTYKEFKL